MVDHITNVSMELQSLHAVLYSVLNPILSLYHRLHRKALQYTLAQQRLLQ